MEDYTTNIPGFLAISKWLTGCDTPDLLGTGMTDLYAQTLENGLGAANTRQFLEASAEAIRQINTGTEPKTALDPLYNHYKFGAICQNIIQMWYTGTWFALPQQWQNLFGGGPAAGQTLTVSAQSYQQGLVWDIAEAHPPGAKQPGYGSWHYAPNKLSR